MHYVSGDFKKEDIAAALLYQTVQDCVQSLLQTVSARQVHGKCMASAGQVLGRCRDVYMMPYGADLEERWWCGEALLERSKKKC